VAEQVYGKGGGNLLEPNDRLLLFGCRHALAAAFCEGRKVILVGGRRVRRRLLDDPKQAYTSAPLLPQWSKAADHQRVTDSLWPPRQPPNSAALVITSCGPWRTSTVYWPRTHSPRFIPSWTFCARHT